MTALIRISKEKAILELSGESVQDIRRGHRAN